MAHQEMMKLHHLIATFPIIQEKSKERVAMLKHTITVIDNIHEWNTQYPDALEKPPRKDWITLKDDKIIIFIKVHSFDKLSKYLNKVLA